MNSYVKMVCLVADPSFGMFNAIMLSYSIDSKQTGGVGGAGDVWLCHTKAINLNNSDERNQM